MLSTNSPSPLYTTVPQRFVSDALPSPFTVPPSLYRNFLLPHPFPLLSSSIISLHSNHPTLVDEVMFPVPFLQLVKERHLIIMHATLPMDFIREDLVSRELMHG